MYPPDTLNLFINLPLHNNYLIAILNIKYIIITKPNPTEINRYAIFNQVSNKNHGYSRIRLLGTSF
jgi:hypothetical protein